MSKNLTVKEQKFVQALVSGHSNTAKEALVDAGYNVTTEGSAKTLSHRMLKKPHIQNALAAEVAKRFPDIPGVGADVLYKMLTSEQTSDQTKLKALEYLMKLFGWQAPTRHLSLNANVGADAFALPGEDEDT